MVRDGNLRELSDDWKLIDFTTYMEALRGELSDKEVIERCGKITLNHTYKMIGREVSELPDAEKHALSDILGGATGNRAIDSWGHWKKSYWDKYGNALAQEAFAEMFAGNISSPRAMEKLREYLPESCKMFDEMVKEIADARIE